MRTLLPGAALAAAMTAALLAAAPARANDFPTADRVLYVQECMKGQAGPYYEMVNKCSCALDTLAREVKHDDYMTMITVVNALTIGGERGSELRDNDTLKPQLKRYREAQAQARQACFLEPK
jgi:hypothetical protein